MLEVALLPAEAVAVRMGFKKASVCGVSSSCSSSKGTTPAATMLALPTLAMISRCQPPSGKVLPCEDTSTSHSRALCSPGWYVRRCCDTGMIMIHTDHSKQLLYDWEGMQEWDPRIHDAKCCELRFSALLSPCVQRAHSVCSVEATTAAREQATVAAVAAIGEFQAPSVVAVACWRFFPTVITAVRHVCKR